MEHTPLDMMDVMHMLQALSATKAVPVVRVPWNDSVTVKRVLDAGATTVMFPFIGSADEARKAVAATRYAPQGVRGVAGMSRASKFGTAPNYLKTANQGMGVIVQLETPAAVKALEDIASVEGVDAVFVGPGDLSTNMGYAGQFGHPAVMELMAQAAQRCKAIGKPIGTLGGTPEIVAQYRAAGFDFVGISSDLGLLMRGAQTAVQALRTQDVGSKVHVHSLIGGTQTDASY
jgi:2-keto-3-deoxy-L-rhamnonate aldolase RhmA